MLHYQVEKPDYLAEIHYPATRLQIQQNALPQLYAAAYVPKPAQTKRDNWDIITGHPLFQEMAPLGDRLAGDLAELPATCADEEIDYLIRKRDMDSLSLILDGFADFQTLEAQKALAYLVQRDDGRCLAQEEETPAKVWPDNVVPLRGKIRPALVMPDLTLPAGACLFGETPDKHYYQVLCQTGLELAVIDALFAQLDLLEKRIDTWRENSLFPRAIYAKPLYYTRSLLQGIMQHAQAGESVCKLKTNVQAFCDKRGIESQSFAAYTGLDITF